jgi:hypothetical protein
MTFTENLGLALLAPVALAITGCFAATGWAADWGQVQEIKKKLLTTAAQHAMEQQKTTAAEREAIAFPADVSAGGGLKLVGQSADSLAIEVTAEPEVWSKSPASFVRIKLPGATDMVTHYSGLTFNIKTEEGCSPEVRLGFRLCGAGGRQIAEMRPRIPVVSPWGENPREVYFDWAFIGYGREAEVMGTLQSVEAIEITAAGIQRAPRNEPSAGPQAAKFAIANLRLVDYLKGSYDPSRQWLEFDTSSGKWQPNSRRDLTLQHRTQEVTGVVARFGGEAGVKSAIESLDFAARTQCWDGSFLDGRRPPHTVASGEYTFGFTLYGLLDGYQALEQAQRPELAEELAFGPTILARREAYQRMLYRGAMSRTAALPSQYRDDIIGGDTLMTGANRVLGYAIAMREVADVLTDAARRKEVLDHYRPIMQQVADAQGKYSGGFPLLGEGDRFNGRGIHYDAGYVRTHMDWLVVGVRRTGDPLLVQMLERYQTVFAAAMDSAGTGILPLISERSRGREPVQLILPDATAQVGLKHKLPIIAQWGCNCGMPVWANWEHRPGNHWSFAASARGYELGAFLSILVDDMAAAPMPKDLGYLFPRQYPIWTTRTFTKDGRLMRTSTMTIRPDGTQASDFAIAVGEYPVTVGVPVAIKSPQGAVVALAEKLSGWPKLLAADAEIEISGDFAAKGRIGETFRLVISKPTHLVITGPATTLPAEAGAPPEPLQAELTISPAPGTAPEKAGLPIELTVLRGTIPYNYETVPAK